MSRYRVAGKGRLDPGAPVQFTFDGRTYTGLRGDTLASALLAHGVHLMGRSFKYHRPRGPVSAGSEEPNALVGTARGPGRFEPNTRATVQELRQGLVAESQNRWPHLKFDAGADERRGLRRCCPPASTTRPSCGRAASGTGSTSRSSAPPPASAARRRSEDPDIYAVALRPHRRPGRRRRPVGHRRRALPPRGPAPSVTLGRRGARDRRIAPLRSRRRDRRAGRLGLACGMRTELRDLGVTVLTRTTAIGYYHQNLIGLVERLTDHLDEVPAAPRASGCGASARGHVVLAQGALEKPLVFHGNDRPGVMLAGRRADLPQPLRRRASATGRWSSPAMTAPGTRPSTSPKRGRGLPAIVDTRDRDPGRPAARGPHRRGIEVLTGHTRDRHGRPAARCLGHGEPGRGRDGRRGRLIHCDCLLMSRGLDAVAAPLLAHQGRAWTGTTKPRTFLPDRKSEAVEIAGAGRGLWGYAAALGGRGGGGPRGGRGAGAAGAKTAAFAVSGDRTGTGQAHGQLPTDRAAAPHPRLRGLPERRHRQGHQASPCRRGCARSSTSSATPPPAWPPTRASSATSTA